MAHLILWIRNCMAREEGQDLAEYALLFALIALVAVGAVTLMGGNISTVFNNIATSMNLGG